MSSARILRLFAVLQEETDEGRTMTLRKLHDELTRRFPEEECSEQRLRADLSVLQELCEEGELAFRMDCIAGAHNQKRYRLVHPKFGLNEARMVFDAISTGKFLSESQKKELISGLEGFLSRREVHALKHRVRVKPCLMQNEQLPQTLRCLYSAIEERRCLNFDYNRFDTDGRQHFDKHYQNIQPREIVWSTEHYYLVALNPAHAEGDQQRNYRVDRMANVALAGPFCLKTDGKPIDCGQFDMFPAKEKCYVTFRLHRDLLDMAFETFGTGIAPRPDPEKANWVRFRTEIELSTGFDRWVLGQADKIEVLDPPAVRGRIAAQLHKINHYYD